MKVDYYKDGVRALAEVEEIHPYDMAVVMKAHEGEVKPFSYLQVSFVIVDGVAYYQRADAPRREPTEKYKFRSIQ